MEIGAVSRGAGAWTMPEAYRNPKAGAQEMNGAAPSLTADSDSGENGTKRVNQTGECQTCKNRKYQDGSDDPGVSFKIPTKMSPERAASAVRGHEMEHVTREQGKARRENKEVVSQSVVYHTAICQECGRPYVSGGTTTTTTRERGEDAAKRFQVGLEPEKAGNAQGEALDMRA